MSLSPSSDPAGLKMARGAALARNWGAVVFRGVLAVLFGIVAFMLPAAMLGSLVLVYGIYAIVDGIFAIISAIRAATHRERWGLLVLEGVVGLIAGTVALFMPGLTIVITVYVIAAWAIVTGALMLAAAFTLHAGHGGWLLGLGGVVSLVWGALLLGFPIAGALVLTLWIGAYALVFGVSMIAFGLRLRARHRASS